LPLASENEQLRAELEQVTEELTRTRRARDHALLKLNRQERDAR
jgi:hypothetical protein